MTEATNPSDFSMLFDLAQKSFDSFRQECEAYGIHACPTLQLHLDNGVELSYYNFKDGNIYASLPDLSKPLGKFYKLGLRSLLHCDSDEELFEFLEFFIPRLIAHEMGHHFRHQYGLFDFNNLWHEEQIANNLAVAVTKHRLSMDQRERLLRFLERATAAITQKIGVEGIATDSYDNFLDALNATGEVADTVVENIQIMQSLFAMNPEDILRSSGHLSEQIVERLDKRDDLIDEINAEYDSDSLKYLYYHLGWFYTDLVSQESHYIDEFGRRYLNLDDQILPDVDALPTVSEQQIRACYKAYLDVQDKSGTARHYFYKRYRSLLLAKLQSDAVRKRDQNNLLKREFPLLLEGWSETEVDRLNYVAQLLPADERKIFPEFLAGHLVEDFILPDHLPAETDRRLWQSLVQGENNVYANNTLSRLKLLEETAMCHSLPAEVLMKFAHGLYRIQLAAGETIIWAGEKNKDVFILIEGELEAVALQETDYSVLGTIQAGDMFGEMAFLTHEARSATIRATRPSVCFVLKASDLHSLAFSHPTILMQMACTLAERLSALNKVVETRRDSYAL